MCQEGLVGEDAVEGRTADGELTGGTKLVAAVEIEDVLDMMSNDRIEGEISGSSWGMPAEACTKRRVVLGLGTVGQREIAGLDSTIRGFEERHLQNTGELTHIAGPAMLQKPGESARRKDDGTELIAGAEAVEEKLRERGDIFATLAKRRESEAYRSEAEGEIGEEDALASPLAKRSFG